MTRRRYNETVGTFSVRLDVGDPERKRFEAVEAVVDTDATYTVLPTSLLRRLGVTPHARAPFLLADGSCVELDIGQTWVRLEGREDLTLVVFGEEGQPLLGALALESFLLAPDPVSQRLVPVPGLLMRAAA
jgi:predicted aspartyl protease